MSFKEAVYAVVKKIPKGKTLTYKQVAEQAGYPKAFRAVGNILNKNYDPTIPCHRVVRSDGKTGGYNRGAERKKEILEEERNAVIPSERSDEESPRRSARLVQKSRGLPRRP